MNAEFFNISFLNWTASAVLLAGMLDDFLTRKVHNWLVVSALSIAVVACVISAPDAFLQKHLLGFFAAIALTLPLVFAGWLGSGDMKLLSVFGLLAGGLITLNVLTLALVWATIWGFVLVCVNGGLNIYFTNIKNILMFKKIDGLKLQAMPFTAPIFLGWITYLKLESLHLQLF